MANEKIMNTRIQLKYDSLTNWQNSAFNGDDATKYLKTGEVAVVTVDTWKIDSEGNQIKVPTCLMKIGDGNTKFDNLNWIAAQAADVYEWAKKSEAEFTSWVKGLIEVSDIDAYSKKEVDDKLAANSVADQAYTDAAIAKLDAEVSQEAGNDGLALSITEVDGKITAISGSIKPETYDAYGAAATAEANAIKAAAEAAALIYKNEEEIKAIAATEIGRLIDVAGDDETLKNIGDLVDYVENNAGDIAELVTSVGTANTNASNALTAANGAVETANTAASNAATALSTANEAKEAATTAQNSASASAQAAAQSATDASNAKSAAEAAQDKAEAAQSKAEEAQGKAEDAQEAAESARDAAAGSANTASAQAAAASQSAGTAAASKADAEAAKTAAVNAQGAAESAAQTASEKATAASESAAEAAQSADDASIARTAAEEAAESASISRDTAEDFATAADASAQAAAASEAAAKKAQSDAEAAAQAAAEAENSASGAADMANSYASAASGSAGDAATAQSKAEAAQTAAETAQAKAEEAQAAAEASNTSATAIANEAKETANAAKTASETATTNVTNLTNTINGYGDIVTHNVAEFATAAQGAKADSALQKVDLVATGVGESGSVDIFIENSAGENATIQFHSSNTIEYSYIEEGGVNPSVKIAANEGLDANDNGLIVADKGITTAKIGDNAVGAAQTKAAKDYTGNDAEVWVFYCGTSSELV